MKLILLLSLVSCALAGSRPASAQLYQTLQQSAQCVLNYSAGTESRAVVDLIRSACNDLYGRSTYVSSATRRYDICLLEHLSSAQSRSAALQIASACRMINPLF